MSFVIYITCWILSIILFFRFDADVTNFNSKLLTIIVIAIIEVVVFVFRHEKVDYMRKRIITTFNLFLLAFICVHFQKFVDLLLFGTSIHRADLYSNHHNVLRAASICLMGLSSLFLGYSYKTNYGKPLKQHKRIEFSKGTFVALNYLYVISLVLFLSFNAGTYLRGNYSQELLETSKGTWATYSIIFLNCSMYSITLLRGYSFSLSGSVSLRRYTKSFGMVFYVCSGIYLLFCFILGDRGPLIFFLLAYLFGYLLATKHRFSVGTVLLVLFAGAFVLNVIGIRRGSDEQYNVSQYNQQIMDVNSISPLTAELASSNRTVMYAVESTPAQFPYRYGLFTINNLLSIIPFSSTILRSLGINFSELSLYAHSSQFLTWYDQGDNPVSGVGSSTVADIYLDFGPIGVVIVLLLLGLLIRKMDMLLFSNDVTNYSLFMLVLGCVFFSQSIYIPRSMLIPILRTSIWTYVFIWLTLTLTKRNAR